MNYSPMSDSSKLVTSHELVVRGPNTQIIRYDMKFLYLLCNCLMIFASAVTGTLNLVAKAPIVKTLPLTYNTLSNDTESWINPPRPGTTTNHDPVQRRKRTALASPINHHSELHHKEKRSDDDAVKDLSRTEWTETCKDNTTFHSMTGRYKTYLLSEPQGVSWDEGENITFTCRLDYKVPMSCDGFLLQTVKNTSLTLEGVPLADEEYLSTSYKVMSDQTVSKYFNLVLNYEKHHQANLSCVYHLTENAILVSQDLTVKKVDELFEVQLTPKSTLVKVGSSFTLTCKLQTHRALEYIHWSWELEGGLRQEINCEIGQDSGSAEFSCSNSTEPPRSTLIVKTTETEDFEEKRYVYYCGTMSTLHASQPFAEVRVTVQAIDRTWITVLGVLGGGA